MFVVENFSPGNDFVYLLDGKCLINDQSMPGHCS